MAIKSKDVHRQKRFWIGIFGVCYLSLLFFSRVAPTVKIISFDLFSIYPVLIVAGVLLIGFLVKGSIEITRSTAVFASFVVYAIASTIWSLSPSTTISASFAIISAAVTLCLFLLWANYGGGFTIWISVLLFISGVFVLISFWELLTGAHLEISRLTTTPYQNYSGATAVYVNRNNLGLYLSMMAPFATDIVFTSRHREVTRVLAGTLIAGLFTVLILNNSRAALFATVAGTALVGLARILQHSSFSLHRVPRLGYLAYGGSTLTFWTLPVLFSNPFSFPDQSSFFIRWQLLEVGIEIASSNLFGVGFGAFYNVAQEVQIFTNGVYSPHNWAIQLGVELGIVGVILFLWVVTSATDEMLALHMTGHRAEWALPAGVSLLLAPISMLGPSDALIHNDVFWTILAIGIAYPVCLNQATEAYSIGT